MDTAVLTPLQVFNLPQHLVIPRFQRRYVWDEERQWRPLWDDVRRVADARLADPLGQAVHFLGAIVVQSVPNAVGAVQVRQVIDGQQRLTTLQLLMDAIAGVLEGRGLDNLAKQLDGLTHNAEHFVASAEDRLKLRQTNDDRDAYGEVMRADPPVDYAALAHGGSKPARAHRFFSERVEEWLGDEDDAGRAQALALAVTQALQLVVIDLKADENSQEIFETLNDRGQPLTAADLVKNFVFQQLAVEGADVDAAYERDWPFDAPFWEQDVASGGYPLSRGSLFINQWLTSRTGEEVSPRQTFTRFKAFVNHGGVSVAELLPVLRVQAELYQRWAVRAEDPTADLGPVELSVYRTQVSGIEVTKPLLIWLHEPGAERPPAVVAGVVRAVESWVFRRLLLRLPGTDLGRVVAELISNHRGTASAELERAVVEHLARLAVVSTYWPGDEQVRRAMGTEFAYTRFRRGRLRMFLETAEDHLRGYTSAKPLAGHRVPRGRYTVEHLLPQSWDEHWPVDGVAAAEERRAHVHRLGNLTLLTGALNTKVANGPWALKRAALHDHDVFLLNKRVCEASVEGWDEGRIDRRTGELVDALLATWPVPEGHVGEVRDPLPAALPWVGVRHLVGAGLLVPGDRLLSRPGTWGERVAVVRADGDLDVDGRVFDTPSAAGKFAKGDGGSTNGWKFWRLADGRSLADLRAAYQG
ncbi:GmrSD restriction endonuclease domain-containing protein [Actinokineospora bangkokensis]|uniref:DUF262 domain-containing protein n=1 Tax=Actinokineospora bangkokensis TaxID=1193682 RepID=A0A1Q9LHK1_9PSEU|nr:DUF262 domain-containing protein [Actinokineospora bangkokensis]OLR91522.1 hypothetical protein BJP25_25435 [Actinokineospora bangkokensis]